VTVLLEHHPKALKLPTMLREYIPLAAACSQEKADYVTYLKQRDGRKWARYYPQAQKGFRLGGYQR